MPGRKSHELLAVARAITASRTAGEATKRALARFANVWRVGGAPVETDYSPYATMREPPTEGFAVAGKHALVAEDDPIARRAVVAALRAMGLDVVETSDGGRLLVALTQQYRVEGIKQFIWGLGVVTIVLVRPTGVWPWLARLMRLDRDGHKERP